MSDPALTQLADWGNFYVIVGSAAGGLTGLMFVVITLAAQVQTIGNENGLSAFVSPTVVHFCSVLLIAAIVASPAHRPAALGLAIGACGAIGIAYIAWAMDKGRRQHEYEPVHSDWLWYGCMPAAAYASFIAAGIMVFAGHANGGLYILAVGTLWLLFTGIHNAWDSALWIAISTGRRKSQPEDTGAPGTDTLSD